MPTDALPARLARPCAAMPEARLRRQRHAGDFDSPMLWNASTARRSYILALSQTLDGETRAYWLITM